MSITIKLFNASIIRATSKKTSRPYHAIQGKIFPKEDGYGDMYFFDHVLAPDVQDALLKTPFNQDSILEVVFGEDRLILDVKVVRPGRYPAEIKDLDKVYADAAARKAGGSKPEQQAETKEVVARRPEIAR